MRHQYYYRKSHSTRNFFLILGGAIIMILVINSWRVKNSSQLINPLSTHQPTATPKASSEVKGLTNSPSLKAAVDNALEGTHGTYGVAIINMKTGESYYSNEHHIFESGSLYKLWIMATAINQIKVGLLKEDQVLDEDISVLNDKFHIDPDLAELTEGSISLTVNQALTQMITISHNYAALLLTEKIRLSTVATFLNQNGLNESMVGVNGEAPTTTASDVALFYQKLYRGELADQASTKKMLDLLKQQKLNDKLPKYLPDEVVVAHKTGELDSVTHDSGIIYDSHGDYVIAVLSDSDTPPAAEERIANISKNVYQYFERR